MNKQHLRRGFTLIEILFVIAIIGVIATLGLASFQQRAQEEKVQKTALQTQQLLQAGMAYYVDNGCWPGGTECTQQPPPDFSPYIPVGNMYNPWGDDYNYQETTDQKKFEVVNDVPSAAIGQRIAAILPNALVSKTQDDKYQITAEVSIPGQSVSSTDIVKMDLKSFTYDDFITKIGVQAGTATSAPIAVNCAPGKILKMVAYPINIVLSTKGYTDSNGKHHDFFLQNTAILGQLSTIANCDQTAGQCSINILAQTNVNDPNLGWTYACAVENMTVEYIAYCIPQTAKTE